MWQQDAAWISSLASSPLPPLSPRYLPPWRDQLYALSGRLLRNTTRHPLLIALNFTATLVLSVVLAAVFFNAVRGRGGTLQQGLGLENKT